MNIKYYYPENLNEDAVILLWSLKNFIIIGICILFSLLLFFLASLVIPAVATAVFMFLCVRVRGNISIYCYLKKLWHFCITDQLIYHGGNNNEPV